MDFFLRKTRTYTENLEFWMTNLSQQLRSAPLIYLTIPGSHDSTSYAIKRTSKLSPDNRPSLNYLKFLGIILRVLIYRWAKTQSMDVVQQLISGIRYFDLRIASKAGADGYYFIHLLFSSRIDGVLAEINAFLDAHPKEVVILDCQHVYVTNEDDHKRIIDIFISIFGFKMAPYVSNIKDVTLESLFSENYQVLVIYRYENARLQQPLLWPSECLQTPWPNTVSIPKLFDFLDEELEKRDNKVGFVSQCVLTPNFGYTLRHFIFGSLKKSCTIPLHEKKCEWIKQQRPGIGGINVVISNFIDYNNCQFSKEVIGLNEKLFRIIQNSHSNICRGF